jgi:hypothetical protein
MTMTMVMPDLRSEAEAEASRLTRARTLTQAGDDDAVARQEGDRAWMAIARGWKMRQALGSRVVLVWRVALEDAAGAAVESRLIAIGVDLPGAGRRRVTRERLEHVVRGCEPRIRAEIARATTGWQRDANQTARSFIAARTARRRAIAERLATAPAPEFQPGLFDRRAERARDRSARQDTEAEASAAEQLQASLSIGTMAMRPAQLLLALAP